MYVSLTCLLRFIPPFSTPAARLARERQLARAAAKSVFSSSSSAQECVAAVTAGRVLCLRRRRDGGSVALSAKSRSRSWLVARGVCLFPLWSDSRSYMAPFPSSPHLHISCLAPALFFAPLPLQAATAAEISICLRLSAGEQDERRIY